MKRTVELTPVILVDTYPSSMLHFIRRRRGVFLIVVLAVASILVFAFGVRPFGGQVGVSTHYLHFGSSGTEHSGWLMPADTLLSWASNPLWVQIDNASLTHSYEISEQTSYAPPSSLTEPGSVAPFILSVKVESYAQ